jgi:aspartyl-tRNA(Asn)/glutamyl-tRNA(Gln) amidotransferase subunit A
LGVLDAWTTHWQALCATLLGDLLPRWQYELDPFVRGLLQRGLTHSAVRERRTEIVRTEMYKSLGPILEEYDVLVCPTLSVPSVPANHKSDDTSFTINGRPVDPYIQWCMTYPFNIVSQVPVSTVPTGFASTGVPTGMQIVGKTFDDMSVMRASSSFESIRPWSSTAPSI